MVPILPGRARRGLARPLFADAQDGASGLEVGCLHARTGPTCVPRARLRNPEHGASAE